MKVNRVHISAGVMIVAAALIGWGAVTTTGLESTVRMCTTEVLIGLALVLWELAAWRRM